MTLKNHSFLIVTYFFYLEFSKYAVPSSNCSSDSASFDNDFNNALANNAASTILNRYLIGKKIVFIKTELK